VTRLRLGLVFGLTSLLLLASTSAHAGPKECIAAADDGQKLRDDGKLTTAREKFIACAAKTCPAVVAKSCSQWLTDVEQNTPSVTFRALDEQGKETFDVRVSFDGATVATSIEARALPVDPGEHTVRFQLADGRSLEDKVLLRQGEKNRMIELSFQAKQPVTPPSGTLAVATPKAESGEPFRVPPLGWVGLGIGVVGGVVTAAFAISANSSESDLRSTCAPTCPSSEKSSIDTKIVLANIGLGVGVVGLGVAVVTTVLANTGPKTKPPEATKPGVAFDAGPGAVMLRGAF
jgi:hypothetical protein